MESWNCINACYVMQLRGLHPWRLIYVDQFLRGRSLILKALKTLWFYCPASLIFFTCSLDWNYSAEQNITGNITPCYFRAQLFTTHYIKKKKSIYFPFSLHEAQFKSLMSAATSQSVNSKMEIIWSHNSFVNPLEFLNGISPLSVKQIVHTSMHISYIIWIGE